MKRPGSRKQGTKRILGIALVLGLLAAGTYAFTATNTVAASNAGDGEGAISGFNVTSVTYTEAALAPDTIDKVNFQIEDSATSVYAQVLDSAGLTVSGTLVACTEVLTGGLLAPITGLAEWTCDFATNPSAASAFDLRVVAYD